MQGSCGRSLSRRTVLSAIAACFLAATAWGQQPLGSIRGRVLDPSGAVVPGASVTLTSATGTSRTVTSDAQGFYRFRQLAPGSYSVDAQAPGFSVFHKDNVQVIAGQTARLHIKLLISTAQAQVEVRANPVQVSVSPSENASAVAISGSALKSLADDPDALLTQIEELAGPSAGPNPAEIYIDGFLGGDLPPKEDIREIRVNQDPFSASYDRLGYGRIEVLTKPGSDNWHGGGFIIGNTSAFNSESPFLAGSAQPPYHTILYGGQLGGPLDKRASFFFSGERRNINRDNLVNTEILSPSFQQVPYVDAVANPRVLTSATPRLDYQLTPNNTLTARYHYFGADATNDGVDTQFLPSQAYDFVRHHHLLQLSDTQILSPQVINETRFQYLHFHNRETPQDFSPTLQVLGAFTGGGSSDGSLDRRESHYELQNLTSMSFTRHYVQFGGFVRDIARRENANTNFNGSFIFNSLASYQATQQDLHQGMTMAQIQAAGLGPSQFNITAGNPWAAVNRLDGSVWVQDDWRARNNLTVNYGLRFESENVIADHADWAPRLGISWGLGHGQQVKTVLRAGVGVFYDRFDDDQMIQAQRLNGINQVSYVIQNPQFFPQIPALASLQAAASSVATIYRIAPNLKSPYALESAVSVEHQITRNINGSVTYLNSRGGRQLLTNDVNAPYPGTYNPADPASGVRPLGATAGNIYEYISEGIYRQNQIIANFRVNRRRVSLFGYYVFNDVHSDTAGVDTFPQDPWNIMADYGRAEFDIRHRVFLAGSIALPYGIQLYPMIMARSGIPFSLALGEDLFGTGIHNGRPAYATESTPGADVRVTPYGSFNINPGPTADFVPPNTATGPAAFTFDLRVSRTFGFGSMGRESHGGSRGVQPHGHYHHRGGLGGRGLSGGGFGVHGGGTERRYALTLSVEAQNLFNDVNLGIPVGDLNSPLFGRSLDLAGSPYAGYGDANRRIDLRLSFSF
ncbi:MAG: carboxypeptidase regulatory-like domain-containing protein [Chlamydiota bacterium]